MPVGRSAFSITRAFRAALPLTVIMTCSIAAGRGHAQTAPPPPPPKASPEQPDIIVTARRWGQAAIAAETELSEAEIRAYAADSIGELIGEIAPLIDGTGDDPAILVNGKRIGSPTEITDYPPEALNRVAILPPEAAARYGYPSEQRVVNLELKQKYASWDADAGVTVPTAGGRHSAQLSAGRTAIDGDTRWNAQVMASEETALLKSARDLPVRDDVLALLPTLQDGDGIDPNRFESVAGEGRSVNLNAGVNRPLGDFSVSLGINAGLTRGKQLIGLPIGSIVLPGAEPVTISRLLGRIALQSRQRTESLGATATLSGAVLGWQTSLSMSYAHSRSINIYDRGYDISAVQRLVDGGDPAFDPYGPWPVTPLLSDRTLSRTDILGASFNASRSVLDLPAGAVSASFTVNAARNRSRFTSESAGAVQRDRFGNDQLDGLWSFTIPVTSRALGVLAPLGDVALDLSAEVGTATGAPTRRKWNAGVRWVPFPFLDLRASIGRENAEPTFDQLRTPRIEIVSRVFDFARQEYVQPISIFGGNPDLEGGRIRSLSLNAMVRPFKGDLATFNIGYRKQVSEGGIASFPELTPDVEAAFPERIRRDADGRLLSIDARPINIAHDRMDLISSGLTLRHTTKSNAPDGAPPPDTFRPWTFSLSIIHNWQLSSETLIRPELPVLDRLRNSGQPRHNVSLNLVAGRPGLGATLNANWNAAARVQSGGAAAGAPEFRFAPLALFNLGFFVEPQHWRAVSEERNWASDLRISLDIQNVLNGYRKVSVLDGNTPRGYTRDEIDPLGRTIRLAIRKQF